MEDNIGRYKVGRDWIEGIGGRGDRRRIEGRGFVRYVFIRCAEHLFDNGSQ